MCYGTQPFLRNDKPLFSKFLSFCEFMLKLKAFLIINIYVNILLVVARLFLLWHKGQEFKILKMLGKGQRESRI